MNVTAPKTVADRLLPRLVNLVQSRKQAYWQWRYCADEHKHRWTQVLIILDERISQGEAMLGHCLDMPSFRIKREVVE